jgi:hypothetical protein
VNFFLRFPKWVYVTESKIDHFRRLVGRGISLRVSKYDIGPFDVNVDDTFPPCSLDKLIVFHFVPTWFIALK